MTTETDLPAPPEREHGAAFPAAPVGSGRRRRRGDRVAYLFLAPWFTGLAVLTAGPLIGSLYLSFTDFNLLQAPTWVGGANYARMFGDDPRSTPRTRSRP